MFVDNRGYLSRLRSLVDLPLGPVSSKVQVVRSRAAHRMAAFATVGQHEQDQVRLAFLDRQAMGLQEQVRGLTEENDTLRRQLSLGTRVEAVMILAKIISVSDTITIFCQTDTIIPAGSAVVLDNALIGVVTGSRSKNLYDVLPTVHPTFKAKVRLTHDGTTYEGIVQGQFGTYLQLTKVLSTAQVGEGDIVVMNDPDKPKTLDFVVGKVANVVSDEAQVFIEAKIMPPVMPVAGQIVFVRN